MKYLELCSRIKTKILQLTVVEASDSSSTSICKWAAMRECKRHHKELVTFQLRTKKILMLQEQIQKSLLEVYSDQRQKLEVWVFQPSAKQKDRKVGGQPYIMQDQHLM